MRQSKAPANVKQLFHERDNLLEELRSDEHYSKTQTLAYGEHDPFEVTIPPCESCGMEVGVIQQGWRWTVSCPRCQKTIQCPQKHSWQAALLWRERNLGCLDYRKLPLFGLSSLNLQQARERMVGIRLNLELRKRLANIETDLARVSDHRAPGQRYRYRLDAYLKWAMLALRLIKLAEKRAYQTEKLKAELH